MKIIDLTLPLDNKTPAYPGDPKIEVKQIADLKDDGWREKRLHLNTHCGTHVDAPAHFLAAGENLDEIPLTSFFGEGLIVDVRKKDIDKTCLPKEDLKSKVILFLTKQSEKVYGNYYNNAKFLSQEVAQELVKRKVKAIGIDSFSPDTEPYPIHKILLPAKILIIENLVNLSKLIGKKFTVYYFPLKITGGDAAPCRAVAFLN